MAIPVLRSVPVAWIPWALIVPAIGAPDDDAATGGAAAVDPSTLIGKVMCGYQGWFNAAGDGAGRGYHHWCRGGREARPAADNVTVDLWPDLSEFTSEERFPTDLRHADGRPAEVFSSFREATVHRHFRWMRDYGIDGIFLQRFASTLRDPASLRHNDAVLGHCRTGAAATGRTFALMYDTSGLRPGRAKRLIEDWRRLAGEHRLTDDPRYLRHRGRPVLALWGCGFSDSKTRPSLDDWREILAFLKDDPEAGGPAIMLGVPTWWRLLERDAVPDPALHEIIKAADIVSPWTVGRYHDRASFRRHVAEVLEPDLAWCAGHGLEYLPVAFPGFSWHNLMKREGREAPVAQIPRRGGDFLQWQIDGNHEAGARMLYVAMFDEVDEGTAIFKCTDDPPTGTGFLGWEGLPSDHYLELTGRAARLFSARRDESPPIGD